MPWVNPTGQAAVSGVSKEYVDTQDEKTLVSAQAYTNEMSEDIAAGIGESVSESVVEAVFEAISSVSLQPEEI